MKTLKWIAIAAVATVVGVQSADAWSKDGRVSRHQAVKAAVNDQEPDHTQFDCREVVGRTITRHDGRNGRLVRVRRECPHVEQMQAGICETHWFKGMRCVE